MIASISSDLVFALRIWALGVLIALGPCSVSAADASSSDEGVIKIELTEESIRVGAAELCSLASLESVLSTLPRSTPVSVEATAETRTEVLFRIREILTTLGFDQISFEGWGDTGWGLYPPSTDTAFHGCGQRESTDSVEDE